MATTPRLPTDLLAQGILGAGVALALAFSACLSEVLDDDAQDALATEVAKLHYLFLEQGVPAADATIVQFRGAAAQEVQDLVRALLDRFLAVPDRETYRVDVRGDVLKAAFRVLRCLVDPEYPPTPPTGEPA
jgi:hypothetical protein